MSKELSSWRAVVEAYQVCNQQFSRLLHHYDLTLSQYDMLMAILSHEQAPTPHQLAQSLLVSKGNITSVAKRLFDRQLIEKEQHKTDARSFTYSLTPAGYEITCKAKAAAKAFIYQQLSPFSAEQISEVEIIMKTMKAHLERMNIEQIASDARENLQ